jgi:hypothetical protein
MFSWTQDEPGANGLIAKRTTVEVVLATDLTPAQIQVSTMKVAVQEGEVAGTPDGGVKQFTKNATWAMAAGSCTLLVGLREYFGTKAQPNLYRYQSTISCIDAAAPTTGDAQPNALTIDQLVTSTALPD